MLVVAYFTGYLLADFFVKVVAIRDTSEHSILNLLHKIWLFVIFAMKPPCLEKYHLIKHVGVLRGPGGGRGVAEDPCPEADVFSSCQD